VVTQAKERIAGIYADGWSRIVATMIRLTGGDWDLAEECAQDAFAQALQKWPRSGIPDEPLAWLTTTARHRAIDRMRRASTEAAKLREVAAMQPDPPPYTRDSEIPDERLELIFTCCHPSLNLDAQVALTLRSLAGLSTAEIARAFLLPERTMGQRLFRPSRRSRTRASRSACHPRTCCQNAFRPSCTCSISSSTRATGTRGRPGWRAKPSGWLGCWPC
jgi:RNA polymerase sigma-70 factor (ECF subfamily)